MIQINGNTLRLVRAILKLTQKELASMLGVSQAYLSALELENKPMTSAFKRRFDIHVDVDLTIQELLKEVQKENEH